MAVSERKPRRHSLPARMIEIHRAVDEEPRDDVLKVSLARCRVEGAHGNSEDSADNA